MFVSLAPSQQVHITPALITAAYFRGPGWATRVLLDVLSCLPLDICYIVAMAAGEFAELAEFAVLRLLLLLGLSLKFFCLKCCFRSALESHDRLFSQLVMRFRSSWWRCCG